MRNAGEGYAEVKKNDGWQVFGRRAFSGAGLYFFCLLGQGSLDRAAVAEVSLIRVLASMSINVAEALPSADETVLLGSAHWVVAPEMVWLIAAAMVLYQLPTPTLAVLK